MAIDAAKMLTELYEADGGKYFDDLDKRVVLDSPAVGVAAADDPMFVRIKESLGEYYWTPAEALVAAGAVVTARSVISWSMPVPEAVRKANRNETQRPARNWAYVRTFGERLITRMRLGLVERLGQLGFAATAPQEDPHNEVARQPGVGLSACWSERHAAFVAGLGTFSLSGGLITARGVAHRLGSVVTDAEIKPTRRPYGDAPFAWCLRTVRGSCGECIRRCPAGSVGETPAARDKERCRDQLMDVVAPWARQTFGWDGEYGCGLCQTDVPCESRNPTESQV